jgi:peptide/nickel transport system substrate-binding protein
LLSWGAGDKDATLEAFEGSWRPAQSVRRLQYRVILEHTARVQALVSGQVDMVSGLQVEDVDELRALGLQVTVQQNPQVRSLALRNLQKGPSPLKDVRVRRALNLAVDKDAIANLMMLGYVVPVGQGAPAGITGHNPNVKPYPYDPAKARALLAESGYAKGLELSFAVVTTTGTPDALTYQKIAQDLAAVGVKLNLQSITFADYQSRYTTGNWGEIDGFSQLWNNAAFQDPIRAIEYFSCLKTNPFFCDPSLVPAIQQINAEINAAHRESLLYDLMVRIHETAPAIWISNSVYLIGYQPKVAHFEMLPSGVMFEKLKLNKP